MIETLPAVIAVGFLALSALVLLVIRIRRNKGGFK